MYGEVAADQKSANILFLCPLQFFTFYAASQTTPNVHTLFTVFSCQPESSHTNMVHSLPLLPMPNAPFLASDKSFAIECAHLV